MQPLWEGLILMIRLGFWLKDGVHSPLRHLICWYTIWMELKPGSVREGAAWGVCAEIVIWMHAVNNLFWIEFFLRKEVGTPAWSNSPWTSIEMSCVLCLIGLILWCIWIQKLMFCLHNVLGLCVLVPQSIVWNYAKSHDSWCLIASLNCIRKVYLGPFHGFCWADVGV